MVVYMNMTLEERLYLLHEMKERQEENFAHLQSIPTDYENRKVQYERSFCTKKKKSHSLFKLLPITVVALFLILAGNGNINDFNQKDINVYYNTLQEKFDLISERIKAININNLLPESSK